MFDSPLHFFVGKVAPALPANRQLLALEQNIQFNVLAPAGVLPGILTTFQTIQLQLART
jgi:hypothetical protein